MDGSTAHIDVTSIPGYAISVNAITENQVKHTDCLDLSQPYLRNARKIANNQYDTLLCTISSFASTPEDFSQPASGSNNPSIPISFPFFSILQYVDQPHELLFMDLFKVDSIHSGPAYFQPTGIFEVTRPKPKKKKYKKVNQHVKPVPMALPEEFWIIQEITGDPLVDIPILSTHLPDFHLTGHYTEENHDIIEENHPGDFLWPDEWKLIHHFMILQESRFTWDESQKGKFRKDFFPPVTIPVIEHIPWVHKNIPIPPGLYHKGIEIVKDKIASGIYEPSSSSYHSKWLTFFKKDRCLLQIVHNLQLLNAVTIRNSGVPLLIEQLAETFGTCTCYSVFNLFVAFDQRLLSVKSRDLMTFQTPLGTFCLSMLPMEWTNSMQVLQGDITYTLTCLKSVHTCNFAKCINTYIL